MAQSVERILGKDEVTGSIPVSSSKSRMQKRSGFSFSADLAELLEGIVPWIFQIR